MWRRLARAKVLEAAERLAAAFFGVFAAVAVLAKAAGAPNWTAIAFAAVGVVGAVVVLVLKVLYERAKGIESRAALWARPPLRMGEVVGKGLLYELGVDVEARESLAALGSDLNHAPYVERDLDLTLRPELVVAAQGSDATELTDERYVLVDPLFGRWIERMSATGDLALVEDAAAPA